MEAVANTVHGHKIGQIFTWTIASWLISHLEIHVRSKKWSDWLELLKIAISRSEKLTVKCKIRVLEAKSWCTSSHSFKTKSDINKNSRQSLWKAFLYVLEQVTFSRFVPETYFGLKNAIRSDDKLWDLGSPSLSSPDRELKGQDCHKLRAWKMDRYSEKYMYLPTNTRDYQHCRDSANHCWDIVQAIYGKKWVNL